MAVTGTLRVKNGKWHAVINYYDANGKRHQKSISTGLSEKGNKREAQRILNDAKIKYRNISDFSVEADMYFDRFLVEWLEIIKTQVEPITFNSYKNNVNNTIVPYFKPKEIPLKDLKPAHIQRFYNLQLERGVSSNTIRHYHANIHKALKYAIKQRLITENPSSLVELPKLKRFVGNFYTDEQVRQLLAVVEGTEIETAIILAVTYGLRRSEIIGLKWDAFNLEQNTFVIRHTVTGAGKYLICADKTKNQSSFRTLPLAPHVYTHLMKLKARQQAMKKIMGSSYHDSDYVNVWDDGRLILPNHLTIKFKRIIAVNGLPKIRLHDLRHTAASILISDGHNLKSVSEYLGHRDIGTTANIYGHLQFQAKVDMCSGISSKFFDAEDKQAVI